MSFVEAVFVESLSGDKLMWLNIRFIGNKLAGTTRNEEVFRPGWSALRQSAAKAVKEFYT